MRCALISLLAVACDSSVGPVSPARVVERSAEPAPAPPSPCPLEKSSLGPGLTAERHVLAATPAAGAPCLDVVRADLAHYRLRLLSSARDGGSHPAPAWREVFHLVAVINAGMFHSNGTPVGLVVEDGNPLSADNKKYGGYLAFSPRSAADAPAIVAGRDCDGFDLADLRKRYRSIVQSSRFLGCAGEPLSWQDKKQYSAAAIGVDRKGRVVFLHARAAVTMTELAQTLATLDLAGAIFLEGGPEASLVVHGSEGELSRIGSYETGFVENDANQSFWWLPNVIALEVR